MKNIGKTLTQPQIYRVANKNVLNLLYCYYAHPRWRINSYCQQDSMIFIHGMRMFAVWRYRCINLFFYLFVLGHCVSLRACMFCARLAIV